MENTKLIYRITEIMPTESGISNNGNEWKSREFVVEEQANVQYPNQLIMRLSGDRVNMLDGLAVGSLVELGYNSRVRAFQAKTGKTMHVQENNCWRVSLSTD